MEEHNVREDNPTSRLAVKGVVMATMRRYPDFQISKWDWLLSQCAITLKLLRNSRVNPAL